TLKGEENNGSTFSITTHMTFDWDRLEAMQCAADEIMMRVIVGGFDIPNSIQRTSKFSSETLPGGRKQSPVYDNRTKDTTLRFGTIQTADLVADESYDLNLNFWGL